jgi:hypothetical protein
MIEEINNTIAALKGERWWLEYQNEKELSKHLTSLTSVHLLTFYLNRDTQVDVDPCSKDVMLPFVTRMHELLPREVRDMIYGYLVRLKESEPESDRAPKSIRKAWDVGFAAEQKYPSNFGFEPTMPAINRQPLYTPHIVRPEYVGPEAACEILEAWYRHNAELGTDVFCVRSFDRRMIERMVCEDVLNVKLDPTVVLRAFTLTCGIDCLSYVASSHKCTEKYVLEAPTSTGYF